MSKKRNKIFDTYLKGLGIESVPPKKVSASNKPRFDWNIFNIEEGSVSDPSSIDLDFDETSNEDSFPRDTPNISDEEFNALSLPFLDRARRNQERDILRNDCETLPISLPNSTLKDVAQKEEISTVKNSNSHLEANLPQTPPLLTHPQKAASIDSNRKNELFFLEKSILDNVILVRHDGGLYYYNGKCYSALRNDMELLELVRKHVSNTAFSVSSIKPFQDLMAFLKTAPSLVPEDYDEKLRKAQKLVALNNGVLHITKQELREFSPKHLLFHSIDASWTDAYPTLFMKFLKAACQEDEEIIRLCLEVMGYLLSGNTNARAFFVIGTATASGKSTLASLLRMLLGDQFVSAINPNRLQDRFSFGSTRGKIINLAMDIPKGRLQPGAVSILKTITGGDILNIEEKYQRIEQTKSTIRFLFGSNHPVIVPPEDNDDDAFWERMTVIPFMNTTPPSQRDPELIHKLWEERDAIVSMCLKHYKTVVRNGFRFSPCRASEEMKASWRRDETSFHSWSCFWSEHVKITGDVEDEIFAQDLYNCYVDFCLMRNIEPIYYTKMRDWISSHVDTESCYPKRIHKTGQNPRAGYCGIQLTP